MDAQETMLTGRAPCLDRLAKPACSASRDAGSARRNGSRRARLGARSSARSARRAGSRRKLKARTRAMPSRQLGIETPHCLAEGDARAYPLPLHLHLGAVTIRSLPSSGLLAIKTSLPTPRGSFLKRPPWVTTRLSRPSHGRSALRPKAVECAQMSGLSRAAVVLRPGPEGQRLARRRHRVGRGCTDTIAEFRSLRCVETSRRGPLAMPLPQVH
jgi:hypothetical protein